MKSQSKVLMFVAFVVLAVIGVVAVSSYIQQNTAPVDSSASSYNGYRLTPDADEKNAYKVGGIFTVNLHVTILTTGVAPTTQVLGESVLAGGTSGNTPATTSDLSFTSAEATMNFDPKYLQVTEINGASGMLVARKTQDNTKGVIQIDLAKTGGINLADNEVIANVKFKVKAINAKGTTMSVATFSKLGGKTVSAGVADLMKLAIKMKPLCQAIAPVGADFCPNGVAVEQAPTADGCPLPLVCKVSESCKSVVTPTCVGDEVLFDGGVDDKGCKIKRCAPAKCRSTSGYGSSVECPPYNVPQIKAAGDAAVCGKPVICVPVSNICKGAGMCTATCGNNKQFSDLCPNDGGYPTCLQWANAMCDSNSGRITSGGVDANQCSNAINCTTTCKNSKKLTTACAGDGFKSCSAWAADACSKLGGVSKVGGGAGAGVTCPTFAITSCQQGYVYEPTKTGNSCEGPGYCKFSSCVPVKDPVCKQGFLLVEDGVDANKCPKVKKCVKITCPNVTPAPGFCSDGKLVDSGKDANGCKLPPKCVINEKLVCNDDVKLCTNGLYVTRDPKNNCQFRSCPKAPPKACTPLPACYYLTGQGKCTLPTQSGYWCAPTPTKVSISCRADYDKDGTVGLPDLAKFALNYGKTVSCDLDIVKNEGETTCVLDINDLTALATIYDQPNACKL